MPLSPQDVRDKVFRPTRLRRGYDEDEVDAFLDEVEAELGRLLKENDELARQLQSSGAAASDGSFASAGVPGRPQLITLPGALPIEAAELGSAPALPAGPEGASVPAPQAAVTAAAGDAAEPASGQPPAVAPDASTAPALAQDADIGLPDSEVEQLLRRTLVLAQRTAEQAIQEARLDAERLRGDAQRSYEEQIGRIEEDRRRLEGQVEQLRSFEREYRTRLRAYLEMQLRELDKSGGPQAGANAVSTAARQPLTPGAPGEEGSGAVGGGPGAGRGGGSQGAGGPDATPGPLPGSGQLTAARTAASDAGVNRTAGTASTASSAGTAGTASTTGSASTAEPKPAPG